MSARFAESAARLAGVAAVLAGWRPEEFWRATPTELATVIHALGGDDAGGAGVGTDDLTRLKEMFPDG